MMQEATLQGEAPLPLRAMKIFLTEHDLGEHNLMPLSHKFTIACISPRCGQKTVGG